MDYVYKYCVRTIGVLVIIALGAVSAPPVYQFFIEQGGIFIFLIIAVWKFIAHYTSTKYQGKQSSTAFLLDQFFDDNDDLDS